MEFIVDLQDGYQVGDVYAEDPGNRWDKPILYVILEIDGANQTMLVEEYEDE